MLLENIQRLDSWTHNKAIQKALESDRVPPERKEYLRRLKIRGGAGWGQPTERSACP